MPRVEKVPDRRKAVPPRLERAAEQPARARAPRLGSRAAGDEQPPPPRAGARAAHTLRVLWLLGLLGATGALVAARYVAVDQLVEQSVAAALGVLLAIGLAVRSGGRALPAAALAVLVGAGAVATQSPTLLGGAAVATGVLAACLAVLATTPAPSFWRAVLEVVLAQAVATAGALAVAGFAVDMDPARFGYTVLGLSLAAAVALVYRLGGGLHGLGRRGVLLVGAALVLLVVGLAYTAALTHWGSPELRLDLETARDWTQDRLGAVPHPIEVFLGVPALAWGVTMRDRRRQGWWVCAFGTTATATAATRLVIDDATTLVTFLGAAYSVVLGLLVGYVVIRVVRLLQGSPGRRAARL
ncbi:MAG: hypothetical protein ABWY19_00140, partial [Marmoricola sp.]